MRRLRFYQYEARVNLNYLSMIIDNISRSKIVLYGVLAFICLISTILRFQVVDIPLERDEGEYAYIAQRWLGGAIPYQDTFDQKPPAIFAVYAIIFRTLGTSIAAIHWGAHVYVLLTMISIFLLSKLLFNQRVGIIATLFSGILLIDPSLLANAANTELFMILPLVVSLLATLIAIKKDQVGWSFVAGIFGALALLFKQVALPNVIFTIALLLTNSKNKWAHLLVALAALFGSLICVASYFFVCGAGHSFYDCVVAHNLSYASRVRPLDYPIRFLASALHIFYSIWPICLMSIIGLFARGQQVIAIDKPNWHKSHSIICLWFLVSLVGVSISGLFRLHYFIQLVPALAILSALGVVTLSELIPFRLNRSVLQAGITLVVISYTLVVNAWYYSSGSPLDKSKHLYGINPFAESPEIGQYLQKNSSPNDRVFIFGSEPQIFFYANRLSMDRYIFCYPLLTPFHDSIKRQHEVIEELQKQEPRLIITVFIEPSLYTSPETPREIFGALQKRLAADYRLIALLPNNNKKCASLISNEAALEVYDNNRWWYQSGDPPFALAIWKRLQ